MDINLQNYKSSKGYLITREIFRSGQCIDKRYVDRSFVKTIYDNTKKYIIDGKVLLPIKLTHEDSLPVSRGYVKNIYLKGNLITGYKIWADIFMYEDTFDVYKAGRLPACSIDLDENGYTKEGKEFGFYIKAISLGAFNAAQPDLEYRAFNDNVFAFSVLPSKSKPTNKNKGGIKFNKERKAMTEEQGKAFKTMFNSMFECMQAFGMSPDSMNEPEEEKPAMIPTPEEGEYKPGDGYSKEIKELISLVKSQQKEITEMKLAFSKINKPNEPNPEKEFDKLLEKGMVKADDKEDFLAFAKVTSLEKATTRFAMAVVTQPSKESPPKNPPTPPFKGDPVDIFGGQTETQYRALWKSAGRRDDEIDSFVKYKKQQAGMGV